MVFSTFQYLLSVRLRSKLGVRREKVSCRVQYRSRTSHDQTLQMKIDFPKIPLCSSGKSSNRSVLRGYLSSARFGQNRCFGEIRGSKLGQLREHRWQSSGPSGKDRQHRYPLVMLKFICAYFCFKIFKKELQSPYQLILNLIFTAIWFPIWSIGEMNRLTWVAVFIVIIQTLITKKELLTNGIDWI